MTAAILIVDDDPIQTELLSSFFRSLGCVPTIAHDGRQAIRHAGALRDLSLIVCDFNMPEADGVEFLGGLADRGCQVPIVMISGAAGAVQRAAEGLATARGLRVVGRMRKPVNFDALREMVAAHLGTSADRPVVKK